MKKLAKIGSVGMTVAVLSVFGLASSASATGVYTTGPWSSNHTTSFNWSSYKKINNNNVSVNNYNHQYASTGDAKVFGNTFGGSAITGAATNWNSTSTNVSIQNH